MPDNTTQALSYLQGLNVVIDVERIYGPISIVLTLFPNCLFLTYEFNRRKGTNSTTIKIPQALILFLSAADSAAILFGYLPVWILTVTQSSTRISYLHCACSYFLKSFFTLSQCLMVLISMEQFTSICKPYFYIRHSSVSALVGSVLCVSTYSMGVGIIPMLNALGYLSQNVPYVLLFSTFSTLHHDYTLIGQDVVLVSVLMLCNICVIRTLKIMEANVATMCINDRKAYLRQLDLLHGTGREISRMMAMISLVFLACCVPNLMRVIFRRFNLRFAPITDYIIWCLSITTGIFNPFLYCLLRKRFRQTFLEQFKKRCVFCRNNRIRDNLTESNDRPAKTIASGLRIENVIHVPPNERVYE